MLTILLPVFFACNRDAREYGSAYDSRNQTNVQPGEKIYLKSDPAAIIDRYMNFDKDSNTFETLYLQYDAISNNLISFILPDQSMHFDYFLDTIFVADQNGQNFSQIVLAKNRAAYVIQGDTQQNIYNASGFLEKRVFRSGNTFYDEFIYKDGNLDQLNSIHGGIATVYTFNYYNDIFTDSSLTSVRFDVYSYLRSVGGEMLDLLNVFGKRSRNLVQTMDVFSPQLGFSITYHYNWKIEKGLIRQLDISVNDTIRQKFFVRSYYH